MTTYELITSLSDDMRKRMIKGRLLPSSIERDLYLYELYNGALRDGMGKMEAYCFVSQKCFVSEPNLRKIIRKMSMEI